MGEPETKGRCSTLRDALRNVIYVSSLALNMWVLLTYEAPCTASHGKLNQWLLGITIPGVAVVAFQVIFTAVTLCTRYGGEPAAALVNCLCFPCSAIFACFSACMAGCSLLILALFFAFIVAIVSGLVLIIMAGTEGIFQCDPAFVTLSIISEVLLTYAFFTTELNASTSCCSDERDGGGCAFVWPPSKATGCDIGCCQCPYGCCVCV